MQTSCAISISRTALLASLVAAGLSISGSAGAADQSGPAAGSIVGIYTQQVAVPVEDAPGHVLIVDVAQGNNVKSGSSNFLDGMRFANKEAADLVQGNGPQHGYITFTNGTDSVTAKWEGQVMTVMKDEKTPSTSMKGTWSYVAGTGEYAGVTGTGTYTGNMIAANAYKVDWTGTYSLYHAKMSGQ